MGIGKLLVEVLKGAAKAPKKIPTAPIPKAPPPVPKAPPPAPKPAPAPAPPPAPSAAPAPKPTPGNTPPKDHKGKKEKKKDDCVEALKKYPVHEYKDKNDHCSKTQQSHHVQQNAQFMVGNKPIKTICPGYSRDKAPCIPLEGKSTDPDGQHGIVTEMQNTDAKASRHSGKAVTYKDATDNAKKQLKAAGLTPKEVKCVMAAVHAKLLEMCSGLTDATILRTPGTRASK